MANQFITNQTPSTYAFCMYNLMACMYNAGWSIMAWSDGTTAHNTGTIPGPYAAGPGSPDPVFPLTGAFPNTGNGGANGLDNTNAWFVMRQPKGTGSVGAYNGNRMIVFQHGSNDTLWRIKYSVGPLQPAGGHVSQYQFASQAGVTPSLYASVVQDDALVVGGGSDSAPTYQTLFGAGSGQRGTSRFNVMCNDGLNFETNPFAIYAVAWNAGAGWPPSMAFVFEPMAAGTTSPGEIDPFVIGASSTSPSSTNGSLFLSTGNPPCSFVTAGFSNVTGGFAWYKYGTSTATFQKVVPLLFIYWNSGLSPILSVPASSLTGNPLSTNPNNSDDDLFPVAWGRPPALGSGPSGFKGAGSMFKWNSAVRTTGDTQAQSTVRDRLIFGSFSGPWDGSVPTL